MFVLVARAVTRAVARAVTMAVAVIGGGGGGGIGGGSGGGKGKGSGIGSDGALYIIVPVKIILIYRNFSYMKLTEQSMHPRRRTASICPTFDL